MTAPDDVRARFEAEFSKPPFELPMPRWGGSYRTGQYQDYNTQCAWEGYRAAHAGLAGEVRELVEALKLAKCAYWLARNSAAGLTNYCEESASSRRCERELSEAESLWHSAGIESTLAKHTPQEKP